MVLGSGASHFCRGAFWHERGGGGIGDGRGGACRALLMPGLCWQGPGVVEDVRGGLGLRCGLGARPGLGLGFGGGSGPWCGGGLGLLLGGGLGWLPSFGLRCSAGFGFQLGYRCGLRWGALPPCFAGKGRGAVGPSAESGLPAARMGFRTCLVGFASGFWGWCAGRGVVVEVVESQAGKGDVGDNWGPGWSPRRRR